MTLKELRESAKMTRTEFCDYFKIPYRTVQSWELNDRDCPEYLLSLIEFRLKAENLIE